MIEKAIFAAVKQGNAHLVCSTANKGNLHVHMDLTSNSLHLDAVNGMCIYKRIKK
jgi:hypothetical protein